MWNNVSHLVIPVDVGKAEREGAITSKDSIDEEYYAVDKDWDNTEGQSGQFRMVKRRIDENLHDAQAKTP